MRWDDLADLVGDLPPGAALWRATGGPLAWSEEMHMLSAVEYRLQILAWQKTEDGHRGRNKPNPIEPPQSKYERRAEEAKLLDRVDAYRRRTSR